MFNQRNNNINNFNEKNIDNIYEKKINHQYNENNVNNANNVNKINDNNNDVNVYNNPSRNQNNAIKNNKIESNSIESIQNSKNYMINKPHLDNKRKNKIENFNDQELNTLEYEKALLYDKRTYFQYYFSLLKKKHLILFTFMPANDYNIYTIKIALFLLSFSLYFCINGFFFSDETMHKIYKDNGIFDILFQIPQILYSTVISAIINIILKTLSLSEKNILEIKLEKDYAKVVENSKKIEKCIIIKFIIFFILSFSFMIFFWYFISCFCAVYTNTQIILIKDTLISFGLSMIYPFGINLIPGIFRIWSLSAEKKDKKCLYKFSNIIALI